MKHIIFIFFLIIINNNYYGQKHQENAINRIKKHLITITKTAKPRNYKNIKTLNFVADYIKKELSKVCDSVAYQNFNVENNTYKNAIGSIGLEHKERIIIGAHYDVCGDSEGADDNASGVAWFNRISRFIIKRKTKI